MMPQIISNHSSRPALVQPALALAFLLGLGSSAVAQNPASDPTNAGKWVTVPDLSDEFNGSSLDTSKWFDCETGTYTNDPVYDGDGIQDMRAWSREGIVYVHSGQGLTVSGGSLAIASRKFDINTEPFPSDINPYHVPNNNGVPTQLDYLCGSVCSKKSIKHGYMEIRAKMTASSSSNAFWLRKANREHDFANGWNLTDFHNWTEIDIYEQAGNSMFEVHDELWGAGQPLEYQKRCLNATVHIFGRFQGTNGQWMEASTPLQRVIRLPFEPTLAYHTYGLEWNDKEMIWYVDGQKTFTAQNRNGQNVTESYTQTMAEMAERTNVAKAPLADQTTWWNSPQGAHEAFSSTTGRRLTWDGGLTWDGLRMENHNIKYPMQMVMDTQIFKGWFGEPAAGTPPTAHMIDYVRVWQKAGNGVEEVSNGTFATNTTGWSLVQAGGASATATSTNGQARVVVTNAGPNRESLVFKQTGLQLQPSTKYRLNFHGQATKGWWVRARFCGNGTSSTYQAFEEFIPGDPLLHSHAVAMIQEVFTTPNTIPAGGCDLHFELGGLSEGGVAQIGTVILDNISIQQVGSTATNSNLILNGTFTSNTTNWVHSNSTAASTLAATGGQAKVTITNLGTQNWHIQTVQSGTHMPLVQGNTYTLKFKAKVATGTRPISVDVSGNSGGVWYNQFAANLTTTLQQFTYTIPVAVTSNSGTVAFFLGKHGTNTNAAAVFIDDVELLGPAGPPPPAANNSVIANGTFDASPNPYAPWQLLVVSGTSSATPSIVSGEYVVDIANGGTQNWHVTLRQSSFPLQATRPYTVKFKARSVGSNRTISINLGGNDGGLWYTLVNQAITTTAQNYSFTFTPHTSTANGLLEFYLGGNNSDVVIDNVSIE